ncbi:protein FAN-like [Anopheles ziemanni]|uniref:protein FAN-like n=2 Tax=coustani group TaxID=59130 RepID=UPI0026583736|nr:protein FAN-like isoform X1 [Anopheles coustani]XP_058176286.1 protein FAN-like [Anopheles ziemanni]
MEAARFSLLLLEPGEIYFEDFSVDMVKQEQAMELDEEIRMSGRLKMCSKSLVFEAKNSGLLPLVKIMYKDCISISRHENNKSGNSDISQLLIRCRQYIEMLSENTIQPYHFVQRECRFLFNFHFAKLDECLQQICQLNRASTLPSYEQNSMIATIVYSRHSRVKFNPLWLNSLYERTVAEFHVEEINPLIVNPGRLLLTNSFIYLQSYNNIHTNPVLKISIKSVTSLSKHRYLLRQIGLKIQWDTKESNVEEQCLYLAFRNETDRDSCFRSITGQTDYAVHDQSPESMTLKWQNGLVSNYDYLLYLNGLADRSFQDLTQYPVFPWIITDYTSAELKLNDSVVYRDLRKPVGALNNERLERLRMRFDEMGEPKFLYGSHYSTPGFVLYYLVRKHPDLMLCLQNGKFDHPDRMFNCVADAFHNCMHNMSDFKELIPEFYDTGRKGDFLMNSMKIDFGCRFDGAPVNNVALPPWAQNSPERFVHLLREALESDYVSANLNHWIDLIFGYKQQGEAALAADNVFYHLCYEGSVDLGQINDMAARHAMEVQISEFGQIPKQLFRTAHVSKMQAIPKGVPAQSSMVIKKTQEYCSHKDIITALAIDGSTGNIFTTSKDGTMTCYNPVERRKIRSVQLSDLPISSVQLPSDQSVVLGAWDNTILIYNFDFGKVSSTIRAHDDAVSCLSYVPMHGLLVSGSWDGSLKIWNNYHNDAVVGYITLEEKIVSIDSACAGERSIRVAVGLQSGELLLFEFDARKINATSTYTKDNHKNLLTHRGGICEVKFNAKGTLIASCGEDRTMYVTDADSSMTICRKALDTVVRCLCWTKDCKYLLMGDQRGQLHVWSMLQGMIECEMSIHSESVYCLGSLDNNQIVSCGKDGNNYCIKLWEIA